MTRRPEWQPPHETRPERFLHYCGFPERVTARALAGDDGLPNIGREVEMSGSIHDKGKLILQSYLPALFAHLAPLALNAPLVLKQEYSGEKGGSASCVELYTLHSSLSRLRAPCTEMGEMDACGFMAMRTIPIRKSRNFVTLSPRRMRVTNPGSY